MPVDPERIKEERRRAWQLAMSVGWELASSTILGVFAGWAVDKKFRTSPWGVLVGAFAGISLGLYSLIRTAGSKDGRAGRR